MFSEIPANDTQLSQTLYDFSPGPLASQFFRSGKDSAHVWVHWYPIDLTHVLTMEIPRFEKVLVLLSHGLLKLTFFMLGLSNHIKSPRVDASTPNAE